MRRNEVSLGEVFTFVSGLYFRGKLAYARKFATPPQGLSGFFVITPAAGLVPPETVVSLDQLREWALNDIAAGDHRYRQPLERDCRVLSDKTAGHCEIVLLGSVATPKYIDPLLEIFRERLLFPTEFVGRGDMSRGGLMLRCVDAGEELRYSPVFNATLHGPRPPKLLPSKTRGFSAVLEQMPGKAINQS